MTQTLVVETKRNSSKTKLNPKDFKIDSHENPLKKSLWGNQVDYNINIKVKESSEDSESTMNTGLLKMVFQQSHIKNRLNRLEGIKR